MTPILRAAQRGLVLFANEVIPPLNLGGSDKRKGRWPLFDQLLELCHISYLEYSLTHFLLEKEPLASTGVALLLSHLILASKQGHLCIRLYENELIPSVEDLWLQTDGKALEKSEMDLITKSICESISLIPPSIICEVGAIPLSDRNTLPFKPLIRDGHFLYLQKHWVFETAFLTSLKKHLTIPPTLKVEGTALRQEVEMLLESRVLQSKQAEAVIQAFSHSLTIITGGPGTGKTYTAGYVISLFWKHLKDEDKKNCRFALCAPTGKAAAQLQMSLMRCTATCTDFPSIEAKTLHALLGIRQGGRDSLDEGKRIEADFVIVDECSMIDAKMMAALLSSLKKGSRLILMGDKNQLPSVEAGSVFFDLIEMNNKEISCIELDVCLRSERKSIVSFAESVKGKDTEKAFFYLNNEAQKDESDKGVVRLKFHGSLKEMQQALLHYITPYFLKSGSISKSPGELVDIFQKMRVLSPLKRGPFGFETLNELIFDRILLQAKGLPFLAIPIMIVSNDYDAGLFNGETGVLIRKLPLLSNCRGEDCAFFPSKGDGALFRQFKALLLPKYTLAYCLSVHKSQGSEFDRVVLVLPEGSESFGKEVLYTAITRAKTSIEVLCSDLVFEKTLNNEAKRQSGISFRWNNL